MQDEEQCLSTVDGRPLVNIGDQVEIKLTGRVIGKQGSNLKIAYKPNPLIKTENEINLHECTVQRKLDVVPSIGDFVWGGAENSTSLGKVSYVNVHARVILVEGFAKEDVFRVYMFNLRQTSPNSYSCDTLYHKL